MWRDPWIPSSSDLKVITPRGHSILTRVCELIDPVTSEWDEHLLQSIFYPVDVRRILQIPIQAFDDFIAWQPNRTGIFSVKTTYHLQWMHTYRVQANMIERPGGSTPLAVWNTLWKLQVPRRIQIFGWRILRGIVPLKAILMNRHVGSNGACPICHQGAEDVKHLLFQCVHAKDVWRRLGMLELIEDSTPVDRSGSVVFEHLLSLPDNQLLIHSRVNFKQALVVGAWYLWWIRRQITHDEPVPPSWRWPISILSIAANFQNTMTKSQEMPDQTQGTQN